MAVTVKKPSKPKLSSGYFQTEMSLLTRIAETTKDFNALAGYLALARHGNGLEQADPFRHTGAGLNAIEEYAHIGENTARKVESTLREHGFVALLPKPTQTARYALTHEALDLALPWAFVVDTYAKASTTVQSVITRLQKAPIPDSLKLDALMVMLNCYRPDALKMAEKGGLDPDLVMARAWETKVAPKANNQEWQGNPNPTDYSYTHFMRQCLSYRIPAKQKEPTQADKEAYWQAWATLKQLGLVYEVVALRSRKSGFVCTLRVQDYHADQGADPSYMQVAGPELAFYAVADGPFNDTEADLLRAVLPRQITAKDYELIGLYRPRFRASTKDTGRWVEVENAHIQALIDRLE